MVTIDPNANLVSKQQYTLSMSAGGVFGTVIGTNVDSVNSELSAAESAGTIDIAQGCVASQSALYVLNQPPYDITFTYTGDGTDSASDVFQQFANVLEGFGFSWDYVTCVAGAAAGTSAAMTGAAVNNAANSLTSPGTLWAIALIALVVVFVMSGGPELARGLKVS